MRVSFKSPQLVRLARLLPAGVAKRFIREQDGAAALEFAIVMFPFFALIFAIMETSLIFLASQTLETAAAESGRLIFTGQAQGAKLTQAAFQEQVCNRIYALFDCRNNLKVDVRQYDKFDAAKFQRPEVDEEGNFKGDFVYDPAGPGCITVVRLYYQWPLTLPLGGFETARLPGDKLLLAATAAFRNEPYGNVETCKTTS